MRMQFRSIICATDFSNFSNRTIPYGVAIAREFEAKLYVCHVIDLSAVTASFQSLLVPSSVQENPPHRLRGSGEEMTT